MGYVRPDEEASDTSPFVPLRDLRLTTTSHKYKTMLRSMPHSARSNSVVIYISLYDVNLIDLASIAAFARLLEACVSSVQIGRVKALMRSY